MKVLIAYDRINSINEEIPKVNPYLHGEEKSESKKKSSSDSSSKEKSKASGDS